MSLLKMVYFQLRLYIKNSYFLNLVLIETTTMVLYQYLAHYVGHTYSGQEWLIAGILGTWASCTTSAGALGFQRFQGTLPYLLNSGISREKVLLATLSPAAIFGLTAFPLAGLESLILGMPLKGFSLEFVFGFLLFWLTATILSYFISLFFVLTRNAIEYEELVLTPILLLSGLLSVPSIVLPFIKPIQLLSPLTLPIKLIYQNAITLPVVLAYIIVTGIFLVLCKVMTDFVVKRAFQTGRLGVF